MMDIEAMDGMARAGRRRSFCSRVPGFARRRRCAGETPAPQWPRPRSGYTLLEMLAYVSIFAIVVNLAAALFVSSTRLRMMGSEALERMQALEEMGAGFSDAVRESLGVVEQGGAYRTTGDTLVLALPGERRYAVLGRLRGDDRLVLMRIHDREVETHEYLKTFPRPLQALEFAHEPQAGGRARIVMLVGLQDALRRDAVMHRFVATPRSYPRAGP
jgi:hypothetical protein